MRVMGSVVPLPLQSDSPGLRAYAPPISSQRGQLLSAHSFRDLSPAWGWGRGWWFGLSSPLPKRRSWIRMRLSISDKDVMTELSKACWAGLPEGYSRR